MEILPQNFVYNTDAVSREQYDAHLKLYRGYVEKTNQITKKLHKNDLEGEANAIYSKYRGLKEGENYAIDGVILHELYFGNMTNIKKEPCKNTLSLLEKYYGCYENWYDDFLACGKASRGWCVLSYEQRTKSLRNLMLDTHNKGIVCMAFPLIAMDVYEHAYFLDYTTNKEKYIEHFIESIDWEKVESRVMMVI